MESVVFRDLLTVSEDIIKRGYQVIPEPPLYIPETVFGTVDTYRFSTLEYKNSISSSVENHQKIGVIRFRKKIINLERYLRVPLKPRAFPPREIPRSKRPIPRKRYKDYVEPKKLYDWSKDFSDSYKIRHRKRYDKSKEVYDRKSKAIFAKRLKIWLELVERYKKRSIAYHKTFEKRLVKYEKRMMIYQKRMKIVSNWKHRPPLVFSRRTSGYPENPYSRERILAINGLLTSAGLRTSRSDDFGSNMIFYTFAPYGMGTSTNLDIAKYFIAGLEGSDSSIINDVINELDAVVLAKLHSKIHKQEIHVGNIIAERHQTVSLFRDTVSRLNEVLSGKKRVVKSVLTFVKNPRLIANDFLAFKFGVEPLLKDTFAAAEALAAASIDDNVILTFRSNSKREFSGNVKNAFGSASLKGTVSVSYVVRFQVPNSIGRFLSSYGLLNPAEIAWEILPWSFVIDWFLPISKYLSDQSSTVGLEFVTGVRTVTITYDRRNNLTEAEFDAPDPADPIYHGIPAYGVFPSRALGDLFRESKRRTVLTSLPGLVAPVIKNPFSLTHGLEALALLVQRLFKK